MNKVIATTIGLIAIIGAAFGVQEYLDSRYILKAGEKKMMGQLPEGTIIAWYHAESESVPEGWVICNGNNGTPDLRGKFLRGEHPDVESTGGTENYRVQDQDVEVHGIGWVQGQTSVHPVGGPVEGQSWGSRNWHILISKGVISGFDIEIVPPYQEITFIMKRGQDKDSSTSSD